MKTKKAIGPTLIMTFAVSCAYWLGFQHGSSSARARIAMTGSPRQIGLAFRHDRNDMTDPFTITGNVAVPRAQTEAR